MLIDEALTPDSSRFWDAASYEPGRPQASFDKQFVRDWLETQPWDKTAPGPALPEDVIEAPGRATSRPTNGSPAPASSATSRRTSSPHDQLPVRGQRHAQARASSIRQGRAVEGSLGHLGIEGVHDVRIGRRAELSVEAGDEAAARAIVERLAGELLSNPLIEVFAIEPLGAASSAATAGAGAGEG